MPKPRPLTKGAKRLSKRTPKQKHAARRLLYDNPGPPNKVYDPDVHPADIVAFFQERFDQIDDPVKYTTEKGQVGYTVKPVRPPTIAGYAARIKVSRKSIWNWGQEYAAFDDALGICQAMQEALLVELGTTGALNPAVTNFTLKNLQDWTDRIEETHKGAVAFQFDAQDEDA